jgi:hypothetical protein
MCFSLAPTAVAPATALDAALDAALAPAPLTASTLAATTGNASLRERHLRGRVVLANARTGVGALCRPLWLASHCAPRQRHLPPQ